MPGALDGIIADIRNQRAMQQRQANIQQSQNQRMLDELMRNTATQNAMKQRQDAQQQAEQARQKASQDTRNQQAFFRPEVARALAKHSGATIDDLRKNPTWLVDAAKEVEAEKTTDAIHRAGGETSARKSAEGVTPIPAGDVTDVGGKKGYWARDKTGTPRFIEMPGATPKAAKRSLTGGLVEVARARTLAAKEAADLWTKEPYSIHNMLPGAKEKFIADHTTIIMRANLLKQGLDMNGHPLKPGATITVP
jgi:hypothetical protein